MRCQRGIKKYPENTSMFIELLMKNEAKLAFSSILDVTSFDVKSNRKVRANYQHISETRNPMKSGNSRRSI